MPPLLSIGASDSFLFSGLEQSTFRVDTSGGGNVFGSGNGFILDGNPYTDVNDANGVNGFGGGPFGIDGMPWDWSVLP